MDVLGSFQHVHCSMLLNSRSNTVNIWDWAWGVRQKVDLSDGRRQKFEFLIIKRVRWWKVWDIWSHTNWISLAYTGLRTLGLNGLYIVTNVLFKWTSQNATRCQCRGVTHSIWHRTHFMVRNPRLDWSQIKLATI